MPRRHSLLQLLRRHGPLSRKDLARLVGLTPASVTILTGRMLASGFLLELGEEVSQNRAGRRKVLLDIPYDKFVVLAASIESDGMTAALCRLNGTVVARQTLPLNFQEAPEEALIRLAKTLTELVQDPRVKNNRLLGLGVGIVGPIDRNRGVSLHAYGLWNQEVPVVAILERELELPVCLENNVRALALAEMDFGGLEGGRQLFLKYGPGIGAALIIDHQLSTGAHNRSGELGHTLVPANALVCRCGRTGCLETVASPQAMIDACLNLPSPPATLKDLRTAVDAGDEEVLNALVPVLDHLATALINAVQLFDPHWLVVYGGFLNHPEILKRLSDSMGRLTGDAQAAATLRHCTIPEDAPFLGGAAVAVRRLFLGDSATG